jgi:type IV pilus assembly protein PilW
MTSFRPLSHRQRGLSLVELMVSVTIALALTVVIANLFIGSRDNHRLVENASRTQENSRFGMQVLGRAIRNAGYRADFTRSYDAVFGTGVSFIEGTEGAGSASDTLTMRFSGSGAGTSPVACADTSATQCTGADGRTLDCLGRRIDTNVIAVNQFQVRTTGSANGGPALFCSINAGTTWIEVVPDIENMQVLFGDPTSTDITVNRYLPASTTTMTSVLSVQVALLYRSSDPVMASPASKSYDLLGTTVGPFNDSRIRTVVTSAFVLRNRAP